MPSRASMKRRRKRKDITLLTTVLAVSVSLAVGVYVASTSSGSSAIDSYIGQNVSPGVMTSLAIASHGDYGPSPTNAQMNLVKFDGGPSLNSSGRPILVYIGGEFCPYCAVERWSLIVSLMRFGNFTGLKYMASSSTEGNYPTFTFVGSSYASPYLRFESFEAADRSNQPLETVPTNYTSVWYKYGGGFPYMNFGGTYILGTTMDPAMLSGKNWSQVIQEISSSDSTGTSLKQSANLITSLLCKLTGGEPTTVCGVPQAMGFQGPSFIQPVPSIIPLARCEAYPPFAALSTSVGPRSSWEGRPC